MTTTKTQHHTHSPPLNAFSRLTAFFTSSSHRHTPPPLSPSSYHHNRDRDSDWIPYRPPPTTSSSPDINVISPTAVSTPMSQYLYTPNPFRRVAPSHIDSIYSATAAASPTSPSTATMSPNANGNGTLLKRPAHQAPVSTFSSASSAGAGHGARSTTRVAPPPYNVPAVPSLTMDPLAALKGKGFGSAAASPTTKVNNGGGNGKTRTPAAFVFPSTAAADKRGTTVESVASSYSPLSPRSQASFVALDSTSGGIGESPRAPITKAGGGLHHHHHYVPFSHHHHPPYQHHSPKSSGSGGNNENSNPNTASAHSSPQLGPTAYQQHQHPHHPRGHRDSGGSAAGIGPIGNATAVRTSLLGFGQGAVGVTGAGGFQNPRKAPQPPSVLNSTIGSSVGGTSYGIGAPNGMLNSATSEGTSAWGGETGGEGSWGRHTHARKTSDGVTPTARVGLSPWNEGEEERERKISGASSFASGSNANPYGLQSPPPEKVASPPKARIRRRAVTESAEVSPLLESFNAVVAEEQQQTAGATSAGPTNTIDTTTNDGRHADAPTSASSQRYRYVVTPPPPTTPPGPIAGPSSMSSPQQSQSSSKKPPVPPKSAITLSRSIKRKNTLKQSSSTPNLAERARAQQQQYQNYVTSSSGWKGKARETVQQQQNQNSHYYQNQIQYATTTGVDDRPATSASGRGGRYVVDDMGGAGLVTSTPPPQPRPPGGGGGGYPSTPPMKGNMFQPQTICDAFMFPKPRFVAHLISPPDTPEIAVQKALPERATQHQQNQSVGPTSAILQPPWMLSPPASPMDLGRIVKEGEDRERERDEWANRASKSLLGRGPSMRSNAPASQESQSIANRLRSRTLSGMKSGGGGGSHRRGDSKETETSGMPSSSGGRLGSPTPGLAGGARISPGGAGLVHFLGPSKTLKNKRSLDFLMAEKMAGMKMALPPRTHDGHPPRTAEGRLQFPQPHDGGYNTGTINSHSTTSKVLPAGKAGKLSISLRGSMDTTTHSRKSSNPMNSSGRDSAADHARPGSSNGVRNKLYQNVANNQNPDRPHSRSGSGSHAASGSMASYALRKVRSLCGPDLLSPALETPSIMGEMKRTVPKGETVKKSFDTHRFADEDDDEGQVDVVPEKDIQVVEIAPRHQQSPIRPPEHNEEWMKEDRHRSLVNSLSGTVSQYGSDTIEGADIQEVRRVSVVAQRGSSAPVGLNVPQSRPSPVPSTPSPAPSSYHGVYGIAVGTPSLSHPFTLPEGQEYPPMPQLPAGPHPSSPTALDIPVPQGGLSSRHRLPPHRANVDSVMMLPAPPSPPILNARESSGIIGRDDPRDSAVSMYAEDDDVRQETEPLTPLRTLPHPYAARTPKARDYRASMNSLEAMLTGEMIESSHTVSPLGVREAGDTWVNSSEAELDSRLGSRQDYHHDHEEPGYSGDSLLGSSNDARTHRSEIPTMPLRTRKRSSATMLVETPPPSMFPSFRQDRNSDIAFDTRTFGDGVSIDQTASLFTAPEVPVPVRQGYHSPSVSTSSTSTSNLSPPVPLGSEDDLDSFQDLFYVPRSRQPSGASPPHHRLESYSDAVSEQEEEHDITATVEGQPRVRLPAGRLMSPLSSVISGELRQSISEPNTPFGMSYLTPPTAAAEAPPATSYFPMGRTSVYDTIEEEDANLSPRSSIERVSHEDVRLGAVQVQEPSRTDIASGRHSTQLSLVNGVQGLHDDDEEPASAIGELPNISLLPNFARNRVPMHLDSSQLRNPHFRTSYLTTASGDSANNRMSHIISDFPPPPPNEAAFLDYYGISPGVTPMVERPDPLSLSHSAPAAPLVPKRPGLAPRSETFGL